jgi:hypothetical protein
MLKSDLFDRIGLTRGAKGTTTTIYGDDMLKSIWE